MGIFRQDYNGIGWGCSSVGTVSERHAPEAGLSPCAARDFPPGVDFQCRLFYGVCTLPPCAIARVNICSHAKDLMVQVKSLVDCGNTKTPSMHRG